MIWHKPDGNDARAHNSKRQAQPQKPAPAQLGQRLGERPAGQLANGLGGAAFHGSGGFGFRAGKLAIVRLGNQGLHHIGDGGAAHGDFQRLGLTFGFVAQRKIGG